MARFAGSGDETALRHLISRFTRPLYQSAYFLLRHPKEAEEAVQECFYRLTQKRATFRQGMRLAPWLFSILRNICIDELRKRQGRIFIPITDSTESPDTTSFSAEKEEETRIIHQALAELPETDREAITLRIYGELDFNGIGEACGISAEAAKKRFYRALESLKEILSPFSEELRITR